MSKRFTIVTVALLLAVGIVLAKVFGPFPVAAAGPKYVSTTSFADAQNEYQAAQTIFNIYVLKQVNDPISAAKALLGFGDRIRVVYHDGQILEFNIVRIGGTLPLDFSSKVPSASYQTAPKVNIAECQWGYGRSGYITINTGYRGIISDYYDSAGVWTFVTGWISTGSYQVFVGSRYPRMCP